MSVLPGPRPLGSKLETLHIILDDTVLIIYSRHAVDALDGPRVHSSSGDRSELIISPC